MWSEAYTDKFLGALERQATEPSQHLPAGALGDTRNLHFFKKGLLLFMCMHCHVSIGINGGQKGVSDALELS